ncbi:hypothetical protein LX73_1023 [Fodinibius salinus]|uniref:DUF4199 domain-containing protein n=1 Tax=Fodinibius salinus TaxID=860790 RepID=A0A5D3YHS8_9BACT|nr:hypothetical protein [Fodinibius salinus]TYP93323.1 hypothetical protein LX73_1023 [Fodinibius salinus]
MFLALLLALTAWLLGLVFPWWSLAIPGLILGGRLGKSGTHAFGYGFLGIGGLWFLLTLTTHISNNGILTERIANLFSLPHPWLVILITVLIGGLAGGFTTLTGYLFSDTFLGKKTNQ